MSVTVTAEGVILLQGACPIEDAEALVRGLSDHPGATIDWSDCQQAHTAVIQVMMAAAPRIVGVPADVFLRQHIAATISGLKSGG